MHSDTYSGKGINEEETHDLERRRHGHHRQRRRRTGKAKGPEGYEEDLKVTRSRRSGAPEGHLRIRHWVGKDEELPGVSWSSWIPLNLRPDHHLRFRRSDLALNHDDQPRLRENNWPEIQKDLSRWRRRSEWPELEKLLSCGPTNCTRVVCSVSPLNAGGNVVIRVRSRLWVDTIEKVQTPLSFSFCCTLSLSIVINYASFLFLFM